MIWCLLTLSRRAWGAINCGFTAAVSVACLAVLHDARVITEINRMAKKLFKDPFIKRLSFPALGGARSLRMEARKEKILNNEVLGVKKLRS